MQEQLEKSAKNREKQRIWRLNNLEKSRELKRKSNWKARGYIPERRITKSSIETFGTRTDPTKEIEVSLCTNCFRKYLTKLYCLWCNNIYGRRN